MKEVDKNELEYIMREVERTCPLSPICPSYKNVMKLIELVRECLKNQEVDELLEMDDN